MTEEHIPFHKHKQVYFLHVVGNYLAERGNEWFLFRCEDEVVTTTATKTTLILSRQNR